MEQMTTNCSLSIIIFSSTVTKSHHCIHATYNQEFTCHDQPNSFPSWNHYVHTLPDQGVRVNYRFLTGIVLANIKCFEEGCLFVRFGFLLDILFSMFQRLMVICCLFAWHLLPFVLQMLTSNLTIHQVNEPFYIPSNKCHSNIGLRRILHINSNFNIFIFSCLWYQICQEFCIGPTRIFESPFG